MGYIQGQDRTFSHSLTVLLDREGTRTSPMEAQEERNRLHDSFWTIGLSQD
jgi:hypothetical protein